MHKTIVILLAVLLAQPACSQEKANSPAVEAHIRDVLTELPADSDLRRNLLDGARGNGVRYRWMDDMRKQGIRRAVVLIDISFDSRGRPRNTSFNRTEYFAQYGERFPISDGTQLKTTRTSGLEKELTTIALEKAKHGSWVDVPHPKPRPFVGGTQIEFLDDEWLPAVSVAVYFAGNRR
jgi:hypothetical protein